MPLQRCVTEKGKPGWKWGESGKCYPGKSGKARAKVQMRAIKASQARRGEKQS